MNWATLTTEETFETLKDCIVCFMLIDADCPADGCGNPNYIGAGVRVDEGLTVLFWEDTFENNMKEAQNYASIMSDSLERPVAEMTAFRQNR